MTTSVPVSLGDRSYHIHIGERLIESAGALLAPHVGSSAARRVPVITDETVSKLYYSAFAASLTGGGQTSDARGWRRRQADKAHAVGSRRPGANEIVRRTISASRTCSRIPSTSA